MTTQSSELPASMFGSQIVEKSDTWGVGCQPQDIFDIGFHHKAGNIGFHNIHLNRCFIGEAPMPNTLSGIFPHQLLENGKYHNHSLMISQHNCHSHPKGRLSRTNRMIFFGKFLNYGYPTHSSLPLVPKC